MHYSLRSGVYFVEIFENIIILDINTNRYLALTDLSAQIWNTFIDGTIEQADLSETEKEILDSFIDEGLIVTSEEQSHSITNFINDKNLTTENKIYSPLTSDLHAFLCVIKAFFFYKFYLKKKDIKTAIEILQHKRQVITKENQTTNPALFANYYQFYRRFTKIESDDCLERSFILCLAMAYYNIKSYLVIGVDNFPFKAHAWTEIGGNPINETEDNIKRYKKIAIF